jgi:5-methylcytosine-specific restriction protein A
MTWETSDRRGRLPDDWDARRRIVRRRAGGLCQADPPSPGCLIIGTECDHIVSGDDHRIANLQWLCGPCHAAKTSRDAHAARAAKSGRRSPEAPPGLL